jgi:hypothetical protein
MVFGGIEQSELFPDFGHLTSFETWIDAFEHIAAV